MKRQAVQLGRFLLSSASLGDTVSDHPDLPNALYADRAVFIGPMRNTFDVRYDPTLHALSLGRVWLGHLRKHMYCPLLQKAQIMAWDYRGACGVFDRVLFAKVFHEK